MINISPKEKAMRIFFNISTTLVTMPFIDWRHNINVKNLTITCVEEILKAQEEDSSFEEFEKSYGKKEFWKETLECAKNIKIR